MATTTVSLEYASKKKNLQDVRLAFTRRMLWSQERNNTPDNATVKELTEVCDRFESIYDLSNSNSTIAIGAIGKHLMIASQGFTFNFSNTGATTAAHISDSVAELFDPSKWDMEFVNCVTLGLGSNFTGIHAEMMIVRKLVVQAKLSKAHLSRLGLVIATTTSKGCCPNCAGFLNSYSVPHTVCRPEAFRHVAASRDAQ